MSMPQHFYVAIIAYDFETSSIVTAALGGPGYIRGISPYLVSTCMHGAISTLDKRADIPQNGSNAIVVERNVK